MELQNRVGMLLPEYVIGKTLRTIINLLKSDVAESTKEDSIIYRLFQYGEDGEIMQWNFSKMYEQVKKMLTTEGNFEINFGYNPKVAGNVALHILLPSENASIAIGADEGYLEEDTYEDGQLERVQNFYTQTFESTYQIMITGVNSTEVLYTYHLLKSMLMMLVDQLELAGLRNPKFSGNDIVMQDDLVQVPIFHKVLNISLMYEHNVPKLLYQQIAKKFHYELHMVDNIK